MNTTTLPPTQPGPRNWQASDVAAKDEFGVFHTAVHLDRMFENGHQIQSWACGEDAETSQANARLIAAAPDLLAALKRAEALLAIAYNPGIEDSVTLTATHCQWAANAARAAIFKAEGAK